MKAWLQNNWDKLLFPLLGVVISGVVGFYAGIVSINSSISALAERTTRIETEMGSVVKPKLPAIDQHTSDIFAIKRDVEAVQRQTDLSVQTNKLLDLRIEQEHQITINALRDMIRDANGQSRAR